MPHYEYLCTSCGKKFSTVLTLAEHEESKVKCPKCGATKVEQQWAAFFATTSKKSCPRSCLKNGCDRRAVMAASETKLTIVGGRRIIDSPLIARAAPASWTFGPSCLVPTV